MRNYHIYAIPPAVRRWFSAQSMENAAVSIPFLAVGNIWTHTSWIQLNDLEDMSNLAGSPFTAGYKTYERAYNYMRAYKFKSCWDISFISSSGTIGPDTFHVMTMPSTSTTSPFNAIFGVAPTPYFVVDMIRRNPLTTYKKIVVNKNTDRTLCRIKSKTFSLKTLLGITPAFEFNASGVPTDPYSCLTSGAPSAGVFMHLLIIRELQSATGPQYSMTHMMQKNCKVIFFGRKSFSESGVADAQL